MIDGRKVLGIIPARGGSKGVPRKNVRDFCGKPLIAWTIEAAKKSRYIDRLILSSDDEEIMAVAKDLGCEVPFKRPAELSQDTTLGTEPPLHAIEEIPGFDLFVLLQPTSPLRSTVDIDSALDFFVEQKCPVCFSVTESDKNPQWMYERAEDGRLSPILGDAPPKLLRQEAAPVFVVNGAIYVADCGWYRENKAFLVPDARGYVMPKERSLDIDSEIDFKIGEVIAGI